MTEEYEVLPHKLLSDLRYDVEALKKKLTQPDAKANELILEIESMKDSIHELNVIFEKAMGEMKDEDSGKTLLKVKEKLDTVVKQNETIARGMIAISDKLEEFMKTPKKVAPTRAAPVMASPMPIQHTMGLPAEERAAPMPGNDINDLPPPPPQMEKKRKGLFK